MIYQSRFVCILLLIFTRVFCNDYVVDPSEFSSVNFPRKGGSAAWGIPTRTDACHAPNDASLFSSSLPVLRHENCMYKLVFTSILRLYI